MFKITYRDAYYNYRSEFIEDEELSFYTDKLKMLQCKIISSKKVNSSDFLAFDREIVLKALVGSHNYNLNTPESDRDYKVFTMPTFEDLYKKNQYSNSVIGELEDLDIHDVRKLVDLFYKANVNFLEVLFSNQIYNPQGFEEMNNILSLKNDIARMNLPYLFNACGGMYLNKMKLLTKGTEGTQHLVEKYGYDTKQALHAYRIMDFIVRFEATGFKDFEKAMKYEGKDLEFMLEIKNGFFNLETFQKFVWHYHDSTFKHLKEKYHSQEVNLVLKDALESLIMSLVKKSIVKSI